MEAGKKAAELQLDEAPAPTGTSVSGIQLQPFETKQNNMYAPQREVRY